MNTDTTIVKLSARTVRSECRRCKVTSERYWYSQVIVAGDGSHSTEGKPFFVEKTGYTLNMTRGEVTTVAHVLLHTVDGVCRDENGHLPGKSTPTPTPEKGEPRNPFNGQPLGDGTPDAAPETPAKAPTPDAAPVTPAPPVKTGNALLDALNQAMADLAPKVDAAEVEAIVKRELGKIVFPQTTIYQPAQGEAIKVEGAHDKLPRVLKHLSRGLHVMVVGPAGTGKTSLAADAAKALDVPFFKQSMSPTMPLSKLDGYMNAAGSYVRVLLREAWEHGGLFLFDEIDNSHPGVLAALNDLLSGDLAAFADGMIPKNEKFYVIAAANTYGRGADRQYVARQAMDAATLDRFSIIEVEVDEALEERICVSTGLAHEQVTEVLAHVRKLRSSASRQKMRVVVSPRASIAMCKLLVGEKPGTREWRSEWNLALEELIYKGMAAQDRSKLNAGV